MRRARASIGYTLAIALGVVGCSSKQPRTENPDTTNLRRIFQAFQLCAGFKNRGPLTEEELKHWLGELGEPGTPEEFLISKRDGQPFVVFYGNMIDPQMKDVVLAHEKDGAEGKRYVLTLGGSVKPFTDAEFAKATLAKKKSPPTAQNQSSN